jgi:nucleoside-diphosphate-sugar epimerase
MVVGKDPSLAGFAGNLSSESEIGPLISRERERVRDLSERKAPRSVIISGSTGVLGSRVAKLLVGSGSEVHRFRGDISCVREVTDFVSGIVRVTHVLNCAAIVPLAAATKDPIRAFQVNAIGAGIFSQVIARKFPDSYFLQISSSHVYAPQVTSITEDSITLPLGTYGSSKLAGEMLVTAVAEETELRLGVARVFSMYSEDQDNTFLYPSLRRRLESHDPKKVFRLKGWNNVRDFCTADQISLNVHSLLNLEATGVINVASGKPLQVGEFAELVAGESLLFDEDDRDPDGSRLVANIDKLSALIM